MKNIIFDLGGVILDLDKSLCVKSFVDLGIDFSEDSLGLYGQNGLLGKLELGLVSENKFYEAFRKSFNCSLSDGSIKTAWNSFLIGISDERLNLLKLLRRKYQLYLLSNTSKIHHDYWDKMFVYNESQVGASYFFEQVHCSYMHRLAKPNPKAFLNVINAAAIKPQETLFFDDSINNCLAAEQIGFKTVHVSSTNDILNFDWKL